MILIVYIGLMGLIMGSFLNVVADRLSNSQSLLGRSKCPKCLKTLSWKHLFPIISYYVLKGKCAFCKAPISIKYPISEIFTSAVYLLTWTLSITQTGSYVLSIFNILIASVFIIMLFSDLRYRIIPDEAQIMYLIISLFKLLYISTDFNSEIFTILSLISSHIAFGVITALPLLVIFLITKARGMGFGDVKLSFVMGFSLGFYQGLLSVYLAFLIGGVYAIFLVYLKKAGRKTMIPFGPFLLIGAYIMMFFEDNILSFVRQFLFL
jgi:leader peptidase (prepilin peptidase)/N-methyltransferase